MPPLVMLAIARQIITDKDNGAVSVISIFSGINAPIGKADAEKLKADAEDKEDVQAISFEWGCAAIFRRTQEDLGKVFEAHFRLIGPNGRIYFESPPSQFAVIELTHTVSLKVNGFPIPQEGTYAVAAFVREYDIESEWEEAGRHLIDVTYIFAEENQATDE